MPPDVFNGLCIKLIEFTNVLEVDTQFQIYTTTILKTCHCLVTRLGRQDPRRAAQCTYITSVIRVKPIKYN